MARFLIVAAASLQIVGVEGTAEAGEVLGVIETDCDVASLVSALNYGGATLQNSKKKAAAKTTAADTSADATDTADDAEPADETPADSQTPTPPASGSRKRRR